MEKGTIQKIFDYYSGATRFDGEVLQALKDFFNKPNLKSDDRSEVEENDKTLFNEWFIFDFRLSNGRTPLENFYYVNPYNFNPARLQIYKDLQENCFGLYEVLEIELGEWLCLKNIRTDKIYNVREFSATFGLLKGQIFSNRVGRVGDHYELVGGDVSFGPIRLNPSLKNIFKKNKEGLNPKTLRNSFPSISAPLNRKKKEYPSFEEAERNLRKILEKYGINKFVSAETIKDWIYNHPKGSLLPFSAELSMLFGLIDPDMGREDYSMVTRDLLEGFNAFYNLCPQKTLGGKSPFEKGKEREQRGEAPDLLMSVNKFCITDWNKKYGQALKYMEQAKFKESLKKFDEVLAYLLKNKTTYQDICRLYTNKGVCHFVLEEEELSEFMLETSVELNSFYNFGKQQLEKCKKIGFSKKSSAGRNKKSLVEDIGYRYLQFLKLFKINFNQPLKQHDAVKDILPPI
ncbi:hypothetical protein BWK69_01005 [Candidatus Parcubacteria bacterium A4]|nr:MAG: hypothetical protein BWK69_01005 [Candidatus Parcubacteria bacterium A4]